MNRRALAAWVTGLLIVAVALIVYRPDRPLPFDLWDFREFLPILQRHPGIGDGYAALLHYYAGHGRMNPLFYLTFVIQYAVFGDWAWGWQLLRFAVMLVDAALLVWLARRLGLDWLGAATAGLLFVVATPMVRAWVQLMAEPLVIGLLLVAAHAALSYRGAPRWRGRAGCILGCILAAFLTKEVAGALGAGVVLLAVWGWSRPVRRPEVSAPRTLTLVVGASVIAIAVAVMIVTVRSRPDATGYGMAYGSAPLSVARLSENLAAIVMPVHPEGRTALGMLYPANVIALLLLGLGMAAFLRQGGDRQVLLRSIGFGLGIAGFGALLYLPWPKFDAFYAAPFFVGPALLLGAAVSSLARAGGGRQLLATIGSVLLIGYAMIPASRSVEAAAAALHLNVAVVRVIGSLSAGDSVVVAGPANGPRRLPVAAAELREYAIATGIGGEATLPVMVDADCAATPPPAAHRALLSYSYGCGALAAAGLRLTASYRWRDWLTLALRGDTLRADLTGPPVDRLRTGSR